jgi:hypothetical protein
LAERSESHLMKDVEFTGQNEANIGPAQFLPRVRVRLSLRKEGLFETNPPGRRCLAAGPFLRSRGQEGALNFALDPIEPFFGFHGPSTVVGDLGLEFFDLILGCI